jgi:hypothetical protein
LSVMITQRIPPHAALVVQFADSGATIFWLQIA